MIQFIFIFCLCSLFLLPPLFSSTDVTFISIHPSSSQHFIKWLQPLKNGHITYKIYAADKALQNFNNFNIPAEKISTKNHGKPITDLTKQEQIEISNSLLKECSTTSCIITDLGSPFFEIFYKEHSKQLSPPKLLAYYDNPEPFVPGGYSKTAGKVIKHADGVIFANARLTNQPIFQDNESKINLTGKQVHALGYYPLDDLKPLLEMRTEKERALQRMTLLKSLNLIDTGQKIFIYLGGANSTYHTEAFPHFIKLLAQLSFNPMFFPSNSLFLLQQHPRSKLEGNKDGIYLDNQNNSRGTPLKISHLTLPNALSVADCAIYYQTSLSPKLALAGIPVFQVAKKPYNDILVRNGICPSASTPSQLLQEITKVYKNSSMSKHTQQLLQQKLILEELGYKSTWPNSLIKIIQSQ